MEPTAVEPTVGTNGAAPAATQGVDPTDYLARASADPEFAVKEITKHQSEAGKLRNELKTLAPLKDIVSRVTGGAETVAQSVYEHAAILQHPEVKAVVDHYRRTGTLPTTTTRSDASETDEYQDPVDLLRSEVTQLREQLSSLSATSHRDRTLIAQTTMQSHLRSLKEKHSDYWDLIEPGLIEQAEAWEKTPQGRELLANSTLESWESIAKIKMAEQFDAIAERRAQARVRAQHGLGTEPKPNTVTTGRETPIKRDEPWRPGMARKLIEDLRRREGRSV